MGLEDNPELLYFEQVPTEQGPLFKVRPNVCLHSALFNSFLKELNTQIGPLRVDLSPCSKKQILAFLQHEVAKKTVFLKLNSAQAGLKPELKRLKKEIQRVVHLTEQFFEKHQFSINALSEDCYFYNNQELDQQNGTKEIDFLSLPFAYLETDVNQLSKAFAKGTQRIKENFWQEYIFTEKTSFLNNIGDHLEELPHLQVVDLEERTLFPLPSMAAPESLLNIKEGAISAASNEVTLLDLPLEIQRHIFSFLDHQKPMRGVCRTFTPYFTCSSKMPLFKLQQASSFDLDLASFHAFLDRLNLIDGFFGVDLTLCSQKQLFAFLQHEVASKVDFLKIDLEETCLNSKLVQLRTCLTAITEIAQPLFQQLQASHQTSQTDQAVNSGQENALPFTDLEGHLDKLTYYFHESIQTLLRCSASPDMPSVQAFLAPVDKALLSKMTSHLRILAHLKALDAGNGGNSYQVLRAFLPYTPNLEVFKSYCYWSDKEEDAQALLKLAPSTLSYLNQYQIVQDLGRQELGALIERGKLSRLKALKLYEALDENSWSLRRLFLSHLKQLEYLEYAPAIFPCNLFLPKKGPPLFPHLKTFVVDQCEFFDNCDIEEEMLDWKKLRRHSPELKHVIFVGAVNIGLQAGSSYRIPSYQREEGAPPLAQLTPKPVEFDQMEGDESLLLKVINYFEGEGIQIIFAKKEFDLSLFRPSFSNPKLNRLLNDLQFFDEGY
ncbi:MAG: hypothetical protein K0S07_92 [Chlamydiales bacterium]|nr:hypothetical protein [Chlamydiales bacterium]